LKSRLAFDLELESFLDPAQDPSPAHPVDRQHEGGGPEADAFALGLS